MYNPPHSKSSNTAAAFDLIKRHPFGTIISTATLSTTTSNKASQPQNSVVVSHIPLTPVQTSASDSPTFNFQLIGHMARANPHWKSLVEQPLTIAFLGGHAYITPVWYEENDVPTWNYSAVHIEGRAELIEDYEGLIECLKTLSAHTESLWPSGWQFYIPDDLKDPKVLVKSIVGFRIHVDRLDFKQKLGRNRSMGDQAGVIQGLATRDDSASHEVRADMLASGAFGDKFA